MRIENKKIYDAVPFLTTTNSTAVDVSHMMGYSIHASWADSTPADKTFVDGDVDVTANTVTKASHGYVTGIKVTLTSTGTLPAGLALLTPYWLIVVSSSIFKFASSYANAIAGTPVDITAAAGGGTHTVAVTVLAGSTVKLQCTNDDITDVTVTPDWRDITSSSTNITAAGATEWYSTYPVHFKAIRAQSTLTAGYVTITATLNAKGA